MKMVLQGQKQKHSKSSSPSSAKCDWSEFVGKEEHFDVKGGIIMTSNQIAYANIEETRRHNQAYEAETAIHNRATEGENVRHNVESERIGWQQQRVGVMQAQASLAHAAAANRSATASLIGANANMYSAVENARLRGEELRESARHSVVSESTEQARTKAYGVSVISGTFKDVTSGINDIASAYSKVRRGY